MTAAHATVAPVYCKRHPTVEKHRNAQGNRVCRECHKEAKARSAMKKDAPAPAATQVVELAPPVPTPTRAPRTTPVRGSFLAVAREYLDAQDNIAPSTVEKRAWLLDQLRAIHDRPIGELTTPDFVRALKAIEGNGDRRETAHRCGMLAGQVTRYAVNHGYAKVNVLPTGQLRGTLKPIKVESHPAITDPRPGDTAASAPKRLGKLLAALTMYRLADRGPRSCDSVALLLDVAPYIFARPGELRMMEWAEVNFERAEWVIPPEKMKMRRPHVVPLATQVLDELHQRRAATGDGRYVFPTKWKDEPLSETACRTVLRTILTLMMREQANAHTLHGFRSCASTLLHGELGIESALVELQLAHAKADKVAGIYDRSQRIPERRELMQKWADYLDRLRAESSG